LRLRGFFLSKKMNIAQKQQLSALIDAPFDIVEIIINILPDVVHALLGLLKRTEPPPTLTLIAQVCEAHLEPQIAMNMIRALLSNNT
jgi:hypothetical protein